MWLNRTLLRLITSELAGASGKSGELYPVLTFCAVLCMRFAVLLCLVPLVLWTLVPMYYAPPDVTDLPTTAAMRQLQLTHDGSCSASTNPGTAHTFLTWNVLAHVHTRHNAAAHGGQGHESEAQRLQRHKAIASAINGLNADIVALQEVASLSSRCPPCCHGLGSGAQFRSVRLQPWPTGLRPPSAVIPSGPGPTPNQPPSTRGGSEASQARIPPHPPFGVKEQGGVRSIITPVPCIPCEDSGGTVTCPKGPRRRRQFFLRLRWSCSGKVRFGSSCMSGGGGGHLVTVPPRDWEGRRAFWGEPPQGPQGRRHSGPGVMEWGHWAAARALAVLTPTFGALTPSHTVQRFCRTGGTGPCFKRHSAPGRDQCHRLWGNEDAAGEDDDHEELCGGAFLLRSREGVGVQ